MSSRTSPLRICAVNFLNTVPLVWGLLHERGREYVDLSFALPSACSDSVAAGHADIGLVPLVEIARQGLEIVPGVGICCQGPVRSILLVSRVPFTAIRTLAADSSSRTSVELARLILRAALSPSALALHRVIVSEATRFPELAEAVNQEGTRREAIHRIAALLEREASAGGLSPAEAEFAAEQFLHMLVAGPQRRALGLGTPMTVEALDAWARDAVDLFLNGCRGVAAR